jgi:hypothetical protein
MMSLLESSKKDAESEANRAGSKGRWIGWSTKTSSFLSVVKSNTVCPVLESITEHIFDTAERANLACSFEIALSISSAYVSRFSVIQEPLRVPLASLLFPKKVTIDLHSQIEKKPLIVYVSFLQQSSLSPKMKSDDKIMFHKLKFVKQKISDSKVLFIEILFHKLKFVKQEKALSKV